MLASQTISAQEVGGVKLADLPGLEVLEQPGDKVIPNTHTLNPPFGGLRRFRSPKFWGVT